MAAPNTGAGSGLAQPQLKPPASQCWLHLPHQPHVWAPLQSSVHGRKSS